MRTSRWKIVGACAIATAALAAAAPATAASGDFSLRLLRSSISTTGGSVTAFGEIANSFLDGGLQPRILIGAAVSQPCTATDGSTAVQHAVIDSASAPHFFTTTVRILETGGPSSIWQATVDLAVPADATICPADSTPSGPVSVDSASGASFVSLPGFGRPPAGTRIYVFSLDSDREVLTPSELTFTTA